MHLKSIEINGFKSFANKILFEFPHGITGIVGPNGSGKSNIGDAVRWVLGEQSARQLRGSRMEDVIFSGTENRRPLGFAYVAIVFDNADRRISLDYDEVKVARRVYRSGESEYLINGSICRRKDIVEIFYDTGIGKEGYSIIGQGQVEKILSGKIEDSRELFDEAAGIAKYKKNRTVTEKSLEQERQNLERVTDILNELEHRVGPLKLQSQKAKEYLSLKEKEKDLDIHLFLADYESLTKEREETKRQLSIVENDLADSRKAYDWIKEKNTALGKEADALAAKTDRLNESKEEKQKEADALENKRQELLHQQESNNLFIHHYEEQEKESLLEQKEKEEICRQKEKEIFMVSREISDLKEEILDNEDALSVLEKKGEKLETAARQERDHLFSLMSSSADIKEKMTRYTTMEEQLLIRNAEYNSRLLACQSEMKQHQNRAADIHAQLEKAKTQEKEASDILRSQEQKQRQYLASEEAGMKKLEEHRQEFLRARSRYETLRNISERYDGYQNSIRHVMEQKKNQPGILGVVADILTLDKKYETAIEIALGGALQNIVTEDDRTAKAMIALLKKNRLGRATFLPLTNIRRKNIAISPLILEEEGVIGTADRLVTVDKRFENLVMSLLGRTIVVDHIDHAIYLSRKNNFSLRIVTLDGELLNPGGAITGGAFRHSGNLLGRKREVEECQERMAKMETSCKDIQEKLSLVKQKREKLEEKISESRNALEQLQLHIHDCEKQLPELSEKEREFNGEIRNLKESHALLRKQLSEINRQKEALLDRQQSDEKSHEKNNDVIESLEMRLSEIKGHIKEQEEEKNRLALDLSAKEQQLIYLQTDEERLTGEIKNIKEIIKTHQNKRSQLLSDNETLRKNIEALEESSRRQKSDIDHLQAALLKLREQQRETSARQQTIFRELETQNERLLTLEKENNKISNHLEKLGEALETKTNYMWDNYEITYNFACTLKQYEIRNQELGACRKEKQEIGKRIRQLGPVNVNAIEEYKDVGERYEFMKGQYEDIKEAEEHLIGMIKELNDAMKEQFNREFEKIREMFHRVFADLFEGGKADLEVMDTENILECGIRIVAQPPGKKLQNILLLSGGERALTAIALLFAIQQLKPSPFCLLDEIEAALDDANIIRFSKYLKRLSKETQFIVITHRRGTMTSADSLYGITMQEKGISTLISVDLIDKQLDA